ncbi:MAG TPA: META domain-containing protein, partial [Chitinophagaceae bacterium]
GTTPEISTLSSSKTDVSTTGVIPQDTTVPMYQHWQRTNARYWTWDMDYPGYERPVAGSYNAAINGNWQLVMTPELVTAWRPDNSRSLWVHDGNTYLSASESFNTRSSNQSGTADVNTGTTATGTTTMNGSTTVDGTASGSVIDKSLNSAATKDGALSSTYDPESNQNPRGSVNPTGSEATGTSSTNAAGTVSSNQSATTHGLNNNASGNATVANQMNGGTSGSPANTTVSANAAVTGTTGTNVQGSVGVNGSVGATGSTSVTGTTGTTGTLDVNSINYNAYNGNIYQLPKFNLYLDNGSFTGYTGCNSISGRVAVSGNSLHFLNTTPSTMIECMGGFDESVLVDMLRRVDSYEYVGDELHLMQGNQVLMKFKKSSLDTTLK